MEIAGTSADVPSTLLNSSLENVDITKDKKKDLGGTWKCYVCNLEEHYDYKGNKPNFAKHLSFLEDCYIMKDPFSSPNKGEILILGADCTICKSSVCMDCSIFYTKRFCKICALHNVQHFPDKLKNKISSFSHAIEEEV